MMQKRPRGRPRKVPLNADEILESLKTKKKPAVLAGDSQPSARQTQDSDDETSQTPQFNSIPKDLISFPPQKQISGNHVGKSTNNNNKSHNTTKTNKNSPTKYNKINKNDKKDEVILVDDEPSDDEIIRDSMAIDDEDVQFDWIGNPIATFKNRKYYGKFKKNQIEYKPFDFVIVDMLVQPPPFFGQILLLWQETSTHHHSDPLERTHDKKMLCKWYYRPEDTNIGKKPCFGDMELFASPLVSECLIANIQGKCKIEPSDQYRTRTDFPHDVFFFRELYDPTEGKFKHTTSNDDPTPTALRNSLPKDTLAIMFKLNLLEPSQELSKSSSSGSEKAEQAVPKSPKRKRRVVDDEDGEGVSEKSHSETDSKPNGKVIQQSTESKKTSTSIQLFNEGMDEDTKGSLDLDLSLGVEAPVRKRLKKPEPETKTKLSNNNNKKTMDGEALDLVSDKSTRSNENNIAVKSTSAPPKVLVYDSQEDSQPKSDGNLTRKSPRITQAAKKREELKQQRVEGLHHINRQLFQEDEEEDKSDAEEIVPDANNNNNMAEDYAAPSTGSQQKYPQSKFGKTSSEKTSSSKTMIDLAESDHEDRPASRTTSSHSDVDNLSKSSSSSSKVYKAQDFSHDGEETKKTLGGIRKPLSLSLTPSKAPISQSRLTELFKIGAPFPNSLFSSITKPQSQISSSSSVASFNPKKKIYVSNYEENNQWDEKRHEPDLGVIEPVNFSVSDINSVAYSSNLSNQSNRLGNGPRGGLVQSSVTSLLAPSSSTNNNTTQKKGLQLKPKHTVVNLEDEIDDLVKSSPPKSKYSYSASTQASVDEIEVDDEDLQREKNQKELEERLKASASVSRKHKKKKKTVHSNGSFIPELFVTNNPQEVDSNAEREHLKAQQRAHRNKPAISDLIDDQPTRRYSSKKSKRPLDKEYESDRSQESEEESDLDGFIVHDTTDPTMNSLDEALQGVSPAGGAKRTVQDEDEDEEEIISEIHQDKVRRPESPELTLSDFTADFSLKNAFGVYVQYVISCNLDETFPESIRSTRSENYFTPAIKKVEGSLEGRKELMLRSTAWHKQFQDDLECYPNYSSWQSTRQNNRDCEACLRSAHHASFEVRLSGTKYDAKKVWKGLILPPAVDEGHDGSKDYVLGKFCHARTQLFHTMHHYKIHLFHRVEKKLESVSADANAEEAVDTLLNDEPWMDQLYDEFRRLIQEADDFGLDGMTET